MTLFGRLISVKAFKINQFEFDKNVNVEKSTAEFIIVKLYCHISRWQESLNSTLTHRKLRNQKRKWFFCSDQAKEVFQTCFEIKKNSTFNRKFGFCTVAIFQQEFFIEFHCKKNIACTGRCVRGYLIVWKPVLIILVWVYWSPKMQTCCI